ncbi:hypothetical protein [Celeribacter sp.]|uniref:hypothetical protein n=1 Tax=Celeribacter sp. TaxID=1890673 RepID=UPI003A8E68FD
MQKRLPNWIIPSNPWLGQDNRAQTALCIDVATPDNPPLGSIHAHTPPRDRDRNSPLRRDGRRREPESRPPLSAVNPIVAVQVVEGFNRARLARRLVQILDLLNAKGVNTDKATYGLNNLAYELRHEVLDDLDAFDGHTHSW